MCDAPSLPGSVQLYAPISQPPLSLPGEPCAMEVYLRTGPDSYVQYGILGGP